MSGDPVTLSATCRTAGRRQRRAVPRYRFSAFWLRSSVVSVLISLISDTSSIRGQYIKWIFGAGSWNRSLLRPLHASTWYCSTSRNGAPPRGHLRKYPKAETGFSLKSLRPGAWFLVFLQFGRCSLKCVLKPIFPQVFAWPRLQKEGVAKLPLSIPSFSSKALAWLFCLWMSSTEIKCLCFLISGSSCREPLRSTWSLG